MPPTPAHPTRPSRSEVLGALSCGVLALAGAISLPLLAAAQPGEGIRALSPLNAAWWTLVAFVVVQAIALLWAKRAPRLVLAAVAVIPLAHAIAVPGDTFSLTTLAVSFAVFWAVVGEPLRRLAVLLPVVTLFLAGCQVLNNARAGTPIDVAVLVTALLQAVVVVGIPLVIGLVFAARRETRVARANEVSALKGERDALIQAAVSRERIAMSRELHDIAAHHVSGIALLASAIYRQVDLDPEAAKVSAQQVRAQSTTVLDDLRRVIGLLRDEAESSRSVETLSAVGELVEHRRTAGVEVGFETQRSDRGLGDGIGPLAQLVAYRMVQESLANAAAHAPGANCFVELDDRASDHLTVLVGNDGSHAPDLGPGSGFGLVGMRERAELVDAELEYGPTSDGGWQVRLTLKRDTTLRGDTPPDNMPYDNTPHENTEDSE